MISKSGYRDTLINYLLENANKLPGCLSYIVSKDMNDDNVIWITEVWNDKKSHEDSLKIPEVLETIGKAKQYIENFNQITYVETIGGHGLNLYSE